MMRDKYEIANKMQENEFESLNDLLRKEIVVDLTGNRGGQIDSK